MSTSPFTSGPLWQRALVICFVVAGGIGGKACYERTKKAVKREQAAELHDTAAPEIRSAFPQPRVAAAFRGMMAALETDSRFMQELKQPRTGVPKMDVAFDMEGPEGVGAQLAARGAARLPAGALVDLIALKIKLAKGSQMLCEGFWSGHLKSADLGAGLDKLDDADLLRWFALTRQAVEEELRATTPLPRLAETDLEPAGELFDQVPVHEREVLMRALDQGTQANPADGCKVFLLFSQGAMTLPEPRRSKFLRAFSFNSLVGPEK